MFRELRLPLFTSLLGFSLYTLAPAAPILTEFIAGGSDAPVVGDGSTPDWIEIHNPDGSPVNLAGYALTDDEEVLQKWTFPEVTLEAGGYVIVFASGDEGTGDELHANFQLDGGGEYLALVDPASAILTEFNPYPEQRGGASYGSIGEELQFFQEPTPGAENGSGVDGFVADTKFNVNRGYYDESFELEITTATEGANITYSLDGSDPAKASIFSPAQKYEGPITISTTTVVRAVAKKSGWQSTNTDTNTYIFHDDVVNQPDEPEGFPSKWGRFSVDYEMDPEITGPNAGEMRGALRSLPTVSFVGHNDDFFGSKGIYGNPESTGLNWEKPISFEWLNKDGSGKFQVDCGARIQGGFFRQASASEKHSFRLLFKSEYGVGRLREDIVDQPGATDSFDTIVFRAGGNDGYAWGGAGTTVQFLRDEFGRRIAAEAGHASPRGGFQHLYINGLYWGLYNLTERPNENFSASYYGGEDGDWDANNSGEVKQAGGKENGNDPSNSGLRDWNTYVSDARDAETYADWMKLQGLNPDGTRNPEFKVYLDADHYADYMIINFWGGNWDWPNKNFWFGRLNTPESTGFKHYTWDFENTMGNNRSRSPLNMKAPRNTQWVGGPYASLKELLWFQVKWADRTQRLFFKGGLLSPDSTIERYSRMAAEIEPAMYAETARWGDDNQSRPHTIDEWRDERDWMLETYLPQRTDIVLGQFEDEDLYPGRAAAVFSQHGGMVGNGFTLTIENGNPDTFYTLDGSDPYEFNPTSGAIELRDTAISYTEPILINGTTTVKARYFKKSIFGGVTWSALSEATFSLGTDSLVISELMYHPTAPTDSERDQGWTSASQFEYLIVKNTGAAEADLKGVYFDAGVDYAFPAGAKLAAGQSLVLARNPTAFAARYGAEPVGGDFDGKLDDGGETLRLVDAAGQVIQSFRYDDGESWPANADGQGATLLLLDPGTGPSTRPDASAAGSWGEGTAFGGGGVVEGPSLNDWLTENGLADANGDGDGDSLTDLLEYALGTDPVASDEAPLSVTFGVGDSSASVSYQRRQSISGAVLTLEESSDLDVWAPISAGDWQIEESSVEGDLGLVQLTLIPKDATVSAVKFLRIAVSQN